MFYACVDILRERRISMKKILSMLLSATLICSFVCPAFATSRTDKQMSPMNEKYRTAVYEQIALSTDTASAERAEITISSGMYLYSFDEKPVAIFITLPHRDMLFSTMKIV